jgi:hypothetical protein
MKYLLVLILATALITSCSPAPAINMRSTASPIRSPSINPNVDGISNNETLTEEAPYKHDTPSTTVIIPLNSTAVTRLPMPEYTQVPISSPMPVSTQGWKTFTSPVLGVAVDYPPDWSVKEDRDGATFSSLEGTVIAFTDTQADGGNGSGTMIGNQRCFSRTNAQDLTAEICVETISFSYSAKFSLANADGSTKWLIMKTITRTVIPIFEAMVNSVRSIK